MGQSLVGLNEIEVVCDNLEQALELLIETNPDPCRKKYQDRLSHVKIMRTRLEIVKTKLDWLLLNNKTFEYF